MECLLIQTRPSELCPQGHTQNIQSAETQFHNLGLKQFLRTHFQASSPNAKPVSFKHLLCVPNLWEKAKPRPLILPADHFSWRRILHLSYFYHCVLLLYTLYCTYPWNISLEERVLVFCRRIRWFENHCFYEEHKKAAGSTSALELQLE